MKLIKKISRRNLLFSFVILLLLGVAMFIVLKIIIAEETDEKLEHTLKNVEKLIDRKYQLILLEPFIEVKKIPDTNESIIYSDTVLIAEDNEKEMYRQLTAVRSIQGETYMIIVRESFFETEDLLETLAWLIFVSLALMFGGLFYLNIKVSKSVWSPFYANLEKLNKFSLHKMELFDPVVSDIHEFRELNNVIKSLTNKVITDYASLKKFSENASHELQTPLAIIRSKIESLLEGNQLNETQVGQIQSMYQSVNRLTKINKELLLLTKIENSQFNNIEKVSLKSVIDDQLEMFHELAGLKKISFSKNYISDWQIDADKYLIETLVNNLLTNAIIHNIPSGKINIELDQNILIIANTGKGTIENTGRLFDRFYKEKKTGSTGLGLSIVKEICKSINTKISYSYIDEMHKFIVEG